MTGMIIESLELENFRNYRNGKFIFSPGSNLLYGDNAQGKTNLLEALYYCAGAKSQRAGKDREMIRFGENEAHIKLLVRSRDIPRRIDIHLRKNGSKGIAVDGIPLRRASELFGTVKMVVFSPEDLNLIKSGPAERRRFLDMELCQLNRRYVKELLNYNRALLQRNKLLKEISFRSELMETLDLWDEQLVAAGIALMQSRAVFLEQLNEICVEKYASLTGQKEALRLCYEPNITEERYASSLQRSREFDLRQKATSVGPHRDDIAFYLRQGQGEEMDLRKFGSQGQQRSAALAVKLSEFALMQRESGENPVFLLDDVLSELDTDRQKQLLKSIREVQTVLTSTGMDNLLQDGFQISKKFLVKMGTVTEVTEEESA